MDFDSSTNKDFMSMLFVESINDLLRRIGVDKKYNWFEMNDKEKNRWRKFQESFKWPDDAPDWME